jgi:hypothetical protein
MILARRILAFAALGALGTAACSGTEPDEPAAAEEAENLTWPGGCPITQSWACSEIEGDGDNYELCVWGNGKPLKERAYAATLRYKGPKRGVAASEGWQMHVELVRATEHGGGDSGGTCEFQHLANGNNFRTSGRPEESTTGWHDDHRGGEICAFVWERSDRYPKWDQPTWSPACRRF